MYLVQLCAITNSDLHETIVMKGDLKQFDTVRLLKVSLANGYFGMAIAKHSCSVVQRYYGTYNMVFHTISVLFL